jgi:hypothetical protein
MDPLEDAEPVDLLGRQGELIDHMSCRLHHGPPLSKWDHLAFITLADILGLLDRPD